MDYDTKIILETERLMFRQHVISDLDAYCAMEMDPDVRRYAGGRPRSREEAENRFTGALEPVSDNLGMWATVYKQESRYIGRCGLYPHFKQDGGTIAGEASIAYYLASAYWGRGLAIEAARAFVGFGFNDLHLNRIVTSVQVGHDASVRILEKLGFELMETETGLRSFYHFALENPGKNLP